MTKKTKVMVIDARNSEISTIIKNMAGVELVDEPLKKQPICEETFVLKNVNHDMDFPIYKNMHHEDEPWRRKNKHKLKKN